MNTAAEGGGTAVKRQMDLNEGELRAAGSIRRNVEWVRRYTDGNGAETRRATLNEK